MYPLSIIFTCRFHVSAWWPMVELCSLCLHFCGDRCCITADDATKIPRRVWIVTDVSDTALNVSGFFSIISSQESRLLKSCSICGTSSLLRKSPYSQWEDLWTRRTAKLEIDLLVCCRIVRNLTLSASSFFYWSKFLENVLQIFVNPSVSKFFGETKILSALFISEPMCTRAKAVSW